MAIKPTLTKTVNRPASHKASTNAHTTQGRGQTPSQASERAADKPPEASVETQEAVTVHWLVKDTIFLTCSALALFMFSVLFTYQPQDPAFDKVATIEQVNNVGGYTGAWLSSMMLYFLGIFALLIPVGLLISAVVTLKIRVGKEVHLARFFASLFGLLLMVISGAGLATLYLSPDLSWVQLPYSGVGVLGYELSDVLVCPSM